MIEYRALTLNGLIDLLEELDPDLEMEALDSPGSYRGYYSELGFELEGRCSAAENARTARSAMGQVFEGYKGGNYEMGHGTPVWIHQWGTTAGSGRIVGIDCGQFVIAADVWR